MSGRRRRVSGAGWIRLRLISVLALAALVTAAAGACGSASSAGPVTVPQAAPGHQATVTFVELGSDKCQACLEMRPVMDAIKGSYPATVNVVFYDVWKDDAPARTYHIQYIPTQVFLDQIGREFYRHVGFLSQDAIGKLLAARGLKPSAQ
ncbi:MAG: thioredoxin family protein [Thermoleophilia bacterium]